MLQGSKGNVCYFKLDSILQGSKVRANSRLTMNGHSKILSQGASKKNWLGTEALKMQGTAFPSSPLALALRGL